MSKPHRPTVIESSQGDGKALVAALLTEYAKRSRQGFAYRPILPGGLSQAPERADSRLSVSSL